MKAIFLMTSIFIDVSLAAQSDFNSQLKAIIADSFKCFAKFKGDESTEPQPAHTRSFSTTIQIEGTGKNRIYCSGEKICIYETVVADSVKLRKGKILADRWKQRIQTAIGTGFIVAPYKYVNYNPSQYGWKFSRTGFNIYIDVYPSSDTKLYRVYLSFAQTD